MAAVLVPRLSHGTQGGAASSCCVGRQDSAAWRRGVPAAIARALTIVRRAVVLSDTVVVPTAGLARVFASIYTLKMGQRKMVEATSGACAQGAISGVSQGADDGCGRGIRPRSLYCLC